MTITSDDDRLIISGFETGLLFCANRIVKAIADGESVDGILKIALDINDHSKKITIQNLQRKGIISR